MDIETQKRSEIRPFRMWWREIRAESGRGKSKVQTLERVISKVENVRVWSGKGRDFWVQRQSRYSDGARES
jgi:hypothetical protein